MICLINLVSGDIAHQSSPIECRLACMRKAASVSQIPTGIMTRNFKLLKEYVTEANTVRIALLLNKVVMHFQFLDDKI